MNQADNDGRTSLYIAAKNKKEDVCVLLIDHGAYVNIFPFTDTKTPLDHAEQFGVDHVLVQKMRDGNRIEFGSLISAAQAGDVEALKAALLTVTDVDEQVVGRSALYVAALFGHQTVCEILLAHGVSVNQRAGNDYVPLFIAANSGFHDLS